MSDREFFEYNIDNIFKNLLQAEYHAKNIIEGKLLPEHLSCINKHLAFVEGEAEEATAHCLVADPESCSFFRQFMLDIRNLRHKILKEGAGPELQSKIRDLRKKLEVRFHQYDTSKCEVCKVNIKPIKSQQRKEESDMSNEKKVPTELEQSIVELIEKNPATISELLSIIENQCYEIADHVLANWQDQYLFRWWNRIAQRLSVIAGEIRDELGDPVSPEKVKELERKGYEIHAHPICVLAKKAKGMTEKEAESECLAEGKVHPISFWAAAYKEKLIS